jgi:hypothetical protein
LPACSLALGGRFAFERTTRGTEVPVVRIGLYARPMARAFVAPFIVDTGCDVPLVLSPPLRGRLKAAGCPSRADVIEWGGIVECERYEVWGALHGEWAAVDAYYPTGPVSEQNLAGLPIFAKTTVCFRPPSRELFLVAP